MKSMDSSPKSSVKSSSTTVTSGSWESEPRENNNNNNNYFRGCRRDANCYCEICVASINATRDLRTTITKNSSTKPILPRSPISFTPLTPRTPKFTAHSAEASKQLQEKMEKKKKKKESRISISVLKMILCLFLGFAAEFGVSLLLSGVFQPKLSADIVRDLGEKSILLGNELTVKLPFLKKELWSLACSDSCNHSQPDSVWEIKQDGLLLSSKHVLYKSMSEEVTIWGWPMQTAGLLTAEFSSRSFTILSGRLTQWQNGDVGYLTRKANESWVQEKWSAFPVQLDPNTWMLEYRQAGMMENPRLISAVVEFLKLKLARKAKKMQQKFWVQFAFGREFSQVKTSSHKIPT